MPRRTKPMGMVGKALENDRKRQTRQQQQEHKMTGVAEGQAARSVLEQSSLDDFISAAELGRANFDSVRGEHHRPVDCSARIVSLGPAEKSTADQEQLAAARRVQVPIPRRPEWNEDMSSDELAGLEGEAFLNWRRSLAQIEEGEGLVMTPYEKNLDFWRQLWRCVERSDLLVQILDARDPEFYRCHDLERYVGEFPAKKHLLLVNKADFLTPELRRRWAERFVSTSVDVLFFSALRELHRQQRVPGADHAGVGDKTATDDGLANLPPHGPLLSIDDEEVADCARLLEELRTRLPLPAEGEEDAENQNDGSALAKRGVVGFVGYPNVGKSSVINALFGSKKVSMSRTPGKTKHLQTLELPQLTLCDCPGLVFPSVVATKAHLVINGTVPITELRDSMEPARLVVEKVGLSCLMEKYNVSTNSMRDAAARLGDENAVDDQARPLLAAMAVARQHYLGFRVPDEGWGARKLLRDYVTGEVLHCEPPPGFSPPSRGEMTNATQKTASEQMCSAGEAANSNPGAVVEAGKLPAPIAEESESDFSDLDDFLKESRGSAGKGMTKRGARQQNKRMQKGGAVLAKEVPQL